jgi:YggT family protein
LRKAGPHRYKLWTTDLREGLPSKMAIATLVTILGIIDQIIGLYIYVVFAAVIASWLIAFNVINVRNDFVRAIVRFIDALTDPVFRLIRRVIPPISGLDLSPLVVLVVLWAIQTYFFPILIGRLATGSYL